MRYLSKFLVLFCAFICSCSVSNKKYLITKISKKNSVYIINAVKNGVEYRIVSLENSSMKSVECEKTIYVGERYKFNLKSIVFDSITPINVDGVYYNNELILLNKDSINDVFESKNIKGLCYTEDH